MRTAITLLVFTSGALLCLGLVILYSAGLRPGAAEWGARFLYNQLIWAGLGLVSCGAMAAMDYRAMKKVAWVIFGVAVVMLILVLVPVIGTKLHGARRWFRLGGFSFQPSELGKLALVIILAFYGEKYQRLMPTFWRGLVVPGVIMGTVLGLIFVEPDRGTTILMALVGGAMLLVAGVRWSYLIPPAIAGGIALAYSLWHDPVRARRILSWLNPEEHRNGVGWQSWQSTIALGAGGWTGVGLGNGRQKLGFVPEHSTDFIFSVIGEEMGLVATMSVVILFVVLVLSGLYIAFHARDMFGFLLGTGLTFLIGLQACINIGVVTAALPNKGLPLPFISYGGSNLLLMMTCVGVLLSIAVRATDRARSGAQELVPMSVMQFS